VTSKVRIFWSEARRAEESLAISCKGKRGRMKSERKVREGLQEEGDSEPCETEG
jgi:hypothetical protein